MSGRLSWARDGAGWPNRESSRFIQAGGLRFHVQVMGKGDPALLLHGTGASSHSFAGLAPRLAETFQVIVPDLPGHGFTEAPPHDSLTLDGMSRALSALLAALAARPVLVIGHSAGAAVLTRMVLDARITPLLMVSLNGAILPLPGMPGKVFAPLAQLFIKTGFMSRLFAWRARHTGLVDQLMRQTGSAIPALELNCYAQLAQSPAHVDAAIGMMAHWDLNTLEPHLAELGTEVLLIAGANDRMIAPSQSLRLRRLLPKAHLELLPDLGHLAHEEAPGLIKALILERWASLNRAG